MKTKTTSPLEIDALSLKKAALHFRAINHPLRQQILNLLHKNGTMTVTSVYVKLKLEQSVASQHLAILRRAKLVINEREGKKVFYRVNYPRLQQMHSLSTMLLHK